MMTIIILNIHLQSKNVHLLRGNSWIKLIYVTIEFLKMLNFEFDSPNKYKNKIAFQITSKSAAPINFDYTI